MSSGNSGNPFPNIVSNLLTPGLKRSKRIAEKERLTDHLLYPAVLMHYLAAEEENKLILTYYPVAPKHCLPVLVHKPLT